MTPVDRPPGTVYTTDAAFHIWEEPGKMCDDIYGRGFRQYVFRPLVRYMRDRGWTITSQNAHAKRQGRKDDIYRGLEDSHLYGVHPSKLECHLEQGGRHIKVQFYQNLRRPPNANPHGGQYDYNKMEWMPYLLRKRVEMLQQELRVMFMVRCSYKYEDECARGHATCGALPGQLTVDEYLDMKNGYGWKHNYRGFCTIKGRALDCEGREIQIYNSRCADGSLLFNQDPVIFIDYRGRLGQGIVEHHINNMHWCKAGQYSVWNIAAHHIWPLHSKEGRPPILEGRRARYVRHLRESGRRTRLTRRMNKAAKEERFLDAERMRVALANRLYLPAGHPHRGLEYQGVNDAR